MGQNNDTREHGDLQDQQGGQLDKSKQPVKDLRNTQTKPVPVDQPAVGVPIPTPPFVL